MFAKLLKHEFKKNTRLFLILSLCALGASILGSALVQLFINIIETNADGVAAILGGSTAIMMWVVILVALIAYAVTVTILLYYRFYKNLFSDEGYLTFTLPVTTHQILMSKILHIAIWSFISWIVLVLSYFIMVLPFLSLDEISSDPGYSILFEMLRDELGSGYLASQVFYLVSMVIYSLILPLLSITIGSLLAKKHKILTSFGIYFGLTTALSLVHNILSIVVMISNVTTSGRLETTYSVFTGIIPGILYLGIGIGGYFIMHHLLDKKLNLT